MTEPVSESLPASRWIHANAGSGKTYALVRQILGLLVRGEKPENILCLTYTNAAASEMRQRLNDRLLSFALMDEAALKQELEPMLGYSPEPTKLQFARQLYLQLLDSEPGVGFYTLHGFCERLLARFPLESGVPPYFTLLDDREGYDILSDAYRTLLAEASRDDALHEAIAVMCRQASEGYLRDLLFESVKHKRSWRHIFRADAVAKEAISGLFGVVAGDSPESLIRKAYPEARLVELRAMAATLAPLGIKLQGLGQQLLQWCAAPSLEQWEAYEHAWCTEHKPRKLITAALESKNPALVDALRTEQACVIALQAQFHAIQAAQATHAMTVLSQRLLQLYDEAKFVRQALDFDDLLLKSLALLSDDALRPWVLYKLDQRIDHLLIDEAQDTSPEQWAILESILVELLQAGGQGEKTLFVVGDLKQSIYSFQGAAPGLFVAQRPLLSRQLEMAGTTLHVGHLAVSRRSVPLIMDMVNSVCAQPVVAAAFIEQASYRPHVSHRIGHAGRVMCLPLVEKTKAAAVDVLQPPSGYVHHAQAADIWAENIADMVRGWLDTGRMLAARQRAVQPGDVLILLQKRGSESAFAQAIIRALEARDIPVAGLDRLQLATHQAVRDHLALLEWCLHPYDDYHLAIALRSPLGGMSEQELFDVACGRGDNTSLWDSLSARLPSHPAVTLFTQWRAWALSLPIQQLLQSIHADGAVRQHFLTRFGKEVQEVLDALLSYAEEYALLPDANLRLFVSRLREDTNELKREAGGAGDKVRVMTVHGSKGLEAPIVILADAAQKPTKRDKLLFVEHDGELVLCLNAGPGRHAVPIREAVEARMQVAREEYYRLLYVALTRAEDELYIGGVAASASEASSGGVADWHQVVSAAMREMGAKEVDGVLVLETTQAPDASIKHSHVSEIAGGIAPLPAHFLSPVAKEDAPLRHLSPSSLGAYEKSGPASGSRAMADRGVVIHKVLQWIDYLQPDGVASIMQLIRREAGHWQEKDLQSAAEDIWRLYRDPALQWIWRHPFLNEANIAGTLMINGLPRLLSGQVDRLVTVDGVRVIIDYKTSRIVPAEADIPTSYIWQMAAYKALLERDGSGLPVRAGLLYTAGPVWFALDKQLASLDFARLDAA